MTARVSKVMDQWSQKAEVAEQLAVAREALAVFLDMETCLGDMKSRLQRLAGMDSGLAKQFGLLEGSLSDGPAEQGAA